MDRGRDAARPVSTTAVKCMYCNGQWHLRRSVPLRLSSPGLRFDICSNRRMQGCMQPLFIRRLNNHALRAPAADTD